MCCDTERKDYALVLALRINWAEVRASDCEQFRHTHDAANIVGHGTSYDGGSQAQSSRASRIVHRA